MKRAVVIGATSGIGKEVARLLWEKGRTVGIAGRRQSLLEQFAKGCGERIFTQVLDVTDENAGKLMLELLERMGGADLIFLSSGIGSQNPNLDPETELRTVQTNSVGFVRMITAAFNYFKVNGGGHIAAISSIAGTKGLGIAPAYSATKRMQNTYIQCLAQLSAMEKANILFTDIRPGFVDTDLLKSGKFPLLMKPDYAARRIVKAVERKRRVAVIDWKYSIVVALWRMIPRCIWERMNVKNKSK